MNALDVDFYSLNRQDGSHFLSAKNEIHDDNDHDQIMADYASPSSAVQYVVPQDTMYTSSRTILEATATTSGTKHTPVPGAKSGRFHCAQSSAGSNKLEHNWYGLQPKNLGLRQDEVSPERAPDDDLLCSVCPAQATNLRDFDEGIPIQGSRGGNRIFPYLEVFESKDDSQRSTCEEIVQLLKRIVDEHHKLRDEARLISYGIHKVGTISENASPAIIVFTKAALAKKLKVLFQANRVIAQSVDGSRSRIRDMLSMTSKRSASRIKLEYFVTEDSVCERMAMQRIRSAVVRSDDQFCAMLLKAGNRAATLSLLLEVDSMTLGLTVHHLFDADESCDVESAKTPPQVVNDHCLGNDTGLVDERLPAQITPTHDREYVTSHGKGVVIENQEQHSTRPSHSLSEFDIHAIAKPVALPASEPYLDWSLVNIDEHLACLKTSASTTPLQVSSRPRFHGVTVLVVSGRASITGRMLGEPSYIGSDRGQALCTTWVVVPNGPDRFEKGDSGSIVLDSETLQIYGHVVGKNALGFGLVVPVSETLRQIKYSFSATTVSMKACLPDGYMISEQPRVTAQERAHPDAVVGPESMEPSSPTLPKGCVKCSDLAPVSIEPGQIEQSIEPVAFRPSLSGESSIPSRARIHVKSTVLPEEAISGEQDVATAMSQWSSNFATFHEQSEGHKLSSTDGSNSHGSINAQSKTPIYRTQAIPGGSNAQDDDSGGKSIDFSSFGAVVALNAFDRAPSKQHRQTQRPSPSEKDVAALLVVAITEGHTEDVKRLLAEGVDVNDLDGRPLYAAALKGHDTIMQLLIHHGAHVDAHHKRHKYGSALQAAAVKGHDRIVRMLLEHGAQVNIKGGYYGNALYAASLLGQQNVVLVLLEYGADVNANCSDIVHAVHSDEEVRPGDITTIPNTYSAPAREFASSAYQPYSQAYATSTPEHSYAQRSYEGRFAYGA